KNTKIGLNDYMEYQTEKATVTELKMQNSSKIEASEYAIIGLPANIFFGTGIPTIIMVLKKGRTNDDVLIIDASKGFAKEGKNNKLRARDIKKIADTYNDRLEIPHFSRRVSRSEIRSNDYNLNIPRYVDSSEKAESIDIYASMFGGIPKAEIKTLGNELDVFSSLENSIKETFTNSAEMGVVSQRDFFDHDIAKADKIDGYYIVQENDFIYNPRISVTAPCGPINRNKLGRKGVMSPLYTIFRTNGINPLFLEWYFKSSCWYAYMYFNGDSGARSDRFSIKNELFFDMPIPLPKDDEQWRIGLLLESLNNLITLHQRQLEKLKNIKSALLEKMFV
ncbi:MAG: N-6 DNA methylase, partial [Christensenellaceae bacterium]